LRRSDRQSPAILYDFQPPCAKTLIPAMKLFSRLFPKPPPPPPPTPAERVASLQAAPSDVLVSTALGGDDTSLRVGAIRLLPDGDALRALAGLADAPQGVTANTTTAVRHAAQQRLAQLIDEGSLDFDALCNQRDRLSESIAVAALCKDPDRVGQVLARIEDPAVLAELATDGPSSRVRQAPRRRSTTPPSCTNCCRKCAARTSPSTSSSSRNAMR